MCLVPISRCVKHFLSGNRDPEFNVFLMPLHTFFPRLQHFYWARPATNPSILLPARNIFLFAISPRTKTTLPETKEASKVRKKSARNRYNCRKVSMQAATLSCLRERGKKYSYKMYYVMVVQSSLRFILSAIKVSDYGMHWELGTANWEPKRRAFFSVVLSAHRSNAKGPSCARPCSCAF